MAPILMYHAFKVQAFIDKSINEWRHDEWRHRLECMVQQNGGHIEHLFK